MKPLSKLQKHRLKKRFGNLKNAKQLAETLLFLINTLEEQIKYLMVSKSETENSKKVSKSETKNRKQTHHENIEQTSVLIGSNKQVKYLSVSKSETDISKKVSKSETKKDGKVSKSETENQQQEHLPNTEQISVSARADEQVKYLKVSKSETENQKNDLIQEKEKDKEKVIQKEIEKEKEGKEKEKILKEKESSPKQDITNKTKQPYPQHFLTFWQAYPRKIGKGAALRAWNNARKRHHLTEDDLLTLCLAALKWQTKDEQWTKENGAYIPHPATYLNQSRWEDENANTQINQADNDWTNEDELELQKLQKVLIENTNKLKQMQKTQKENE